MSQLSALSHLLPELTLAIGAMALLMVGVFRPERENDGEPIGWLSLLVLLIAGGFVVLQSSATVTLFDGAFRIDTFSRFMKLLVLSAAAFALLLAFDELKETRTFKFEFPILILLATTGMMMMISANDLIALYLGLELQSLSLYVIAAWRRDSLRSSEAGLKYFMLGALSSGMLLYGASLLYGFTGSTNFDIIAKVAASAGAGQNIGLTFGLVFLLVGIAFKVSAVPFHMWTPDVYEGSPTPVTAFFAAAPKVAAMALLMRVTLGAFPGIAAQWQQIIVFISIASMLLGAFAAIGQTNIKRLMAYSSIANIGFALVPLAAGTREGAEGVLVYLAIYVIMTLGTFACILSMQRDDGPVEEIEELAGLAENNLPMAFVLGMLMFSLAGIPPLAGFWAKFYAFLPVIKVGGGLTYLAIIGVVASVIGAYYYLRIVKIMFFDPAREKFLPVKSKAGLVMGLSGLAVIGFVVLPAPLIAAAAAAAKSFRF